MDFYTLLAQVMALLQREGRVSYRILKLQFTLDDEILEALRVRVDCLSTRSVPRPRPSVKSTIPHFYADSAVHFRMAGELLSIEDTDGHMGQLLKLLKPVLRGFSCDGRTVAAVAQPN